ncbi:hypothetical protein Patl1_26842 [Pistacia atlantica]|uniref:Uncharacterized protein n=1 Tax=Pistacia atlantica TaxID=434234 RepID=A0ACC1B2Q6_9ROSI|nr:hypothetical protein Patl1_26842 [Pistacia atlantica]
MASRAILRRKRLISDYLNVYTRSIQSFQCLGHVVQNRKLCDYSSSANQTCADFNCADKTNAFSVTKGELQGFSGFRHFVLKNHGITVLGLGNGRSELIPPMGFRLMSHSVRNSSSATAKQPEMVSDDEENEELVSKKRKQASPEECDQAVEGLSTAKAKAMAKKLQETQKVANSVLHRSWAMLLGIGPALRAVASMSRKFPSHLKTLVLKELTLVKDVGLCRYVDFFVITRNKVRRGAGVSNEEILSFAKLFNDELTLDNISRSASVAFSLPFQFNASEPRLVNMCKYMGISPFGTDAYLRFMLRKRLQWIKNDDMLIQAEGVESLSEAELREDCRERGMLGLLSVEEMRQQLRDWLDLSLNHSVPSSLLILSRSFTVSGKLRPEEAVGATLSSLPDEVVGTVGVTALPSEDSVSERRRKLEYLAMQEELIKEEQEKEEKELARMKENRASEEDVALKEMTIATASEGHKQARARTFEKQEQLCKLSQALAVLASASLLSSSIYFDLASLILQSVSSEREEFLGLVNKEIGLYNSMVDREGTDGEKDAIKAYKAAREETDHSDEVAERDEVSSALRERVDAMLQNLEKEIDDVDAKIGDRWQLLDRDLDGKVTPEEVAGAALYLKDTLGKQGVQELISSLSKDRGEQGCEYFLFLAWLLIQMVRFLWKTLSNWAVGQKIPIQQKGQNIEDNSLFTDYMACTLIWSGVVSRVAAEKSLNFSGSNVPFLYTLALYTTSRMNY